MCEFVHFKRLLLHLTKYVLLRGHESPPLAAPQGRALSISAVTLLPPVPSGHRTFPPRPALTPPFQPPAKTRSVRGCARIREGQQRSRVGEMAACVRGRAPSSQWEGIGTSKEGLPQGSDPALALLGLLSSIMTLEGMNSGHFFCQGPHSPFGEPSEGSPSAGSWEPGPAHNQGPCFQKEVQHQH